MRQVQFFAVLELMTLVLLRDTDVTVDVLATVCVGLVVRLVSELLLLLERGCVMVICISLLEVLWSVGVIDSVLCLVIGEVRGRYLTGGCRSAVKVITNYFDI